MKRKMVTALVTCGLLTSSLLTGCGQEETAPAAPPREVIEGDDASESSAQTDEVEEPADETESETERRDGQETLGEEPEREGCFQ